jgi:hypothetical protein
MKRMNSNTGFPQEAFMCFMFFMVHCSQYDLGSPSTCSATYARIRFVEIGATW